MAKQIVTTLTMPGTGMEDLAFDGKDAFLYQALKGSNLLVKIDVASGKVTATWPTAPAEKPHGVAMVDADSILVVGGNGKLVLMSLSTGKVLSSADIAQKVDEIAYDPALHRVYCASGTGVVSVVGLDQNKLTTLAPLTSSPGTHSVAVDPQTPHRVDRLRQGRQSLRAILQHEVSSTVHLKPRCPQVRTLQAW